jgi:RecB family endonuclease NucS
MPILESKRLRTQTRLFQYEKELKRSLRQELEKIEPGLVADDGGRERVVATGKIDITARDKDGHFVVIELKVGPCPIGALEQVLAYSSDLEAETGVPCRSVLVASEFSDRIKAAAKRARDVYLVHYAVEKMGFAGQLPLQP